MPNNWFDYSKFETNGEFNLWFKAAKQGDAEAQYEVGFILYSTGDKQDGLEALKWFLKSAKKGFAEAQFMLGLNYTN